MNLDQRLPDFPISYYFHCIHVEWICFLFFHHFFGVGVGVKAERSQKKIVSVLNPHQAPHCVTMKDTGMA